MYGCPQADGGGEREVPGINRKLKKKKYISTDVTDGHRY